MTSCSVSVKSFLFLIFAVSNETFICIATVFYNEQLIEVQLSSKYELLYTSEMCQDKDAQGLINTSSIFCRYEVIGGMQDVSWPSRPFLTLEFFRLLSSLG